MRGTAVDPRAADQCPQPDLALCRAPRAGTVVAGTGPVLAAEELLRRLGILCDPADVGANRVGLRLLEAA